MKICFLVCCSVLQCVSACCSVLQCVICCPWVSVAEYHESISRSAFCSRTLCITLKTCFPVCCGVLRCAAACCSVLRCVAVCCRILQFVVVCCSVLSSAREFLQPNVMDSRHDLLSAAEHRASLWRYTSQCVAVCCSALQCVAACWVVLQSVLRCVAAWYLLPVSFWSRLANARTYHTHKQILCWRCRSPSKCWIAIIQNCMRLSHVTYVERYTWINICHICGYVYVDKCIKIFWIAIVFIYICDMTHSHTFHRSHVSHDRWYIECPARPPRRMLFSLSLSLSLSRAHTHTHTHTYTHIHTQT